MTSAKHNGRSVLITWPDYAASYPEGSARLEAAGLSARYAPKLGARSVGELRALLGDAAGAIVSTDPFTRDVLDISPGLKVIARVGVGYDSIDLDAATRCGVAVTVTTGASEATVADHAVALMLGVLRDVINHDSRVRDGKWLRTGSYASSQLTGATVLIVGFGSIGRQVRERLRGFDTEVLVFDPALHDSADVEVVALHDGIARADVVSVHTPLLDSTRNLFGPNEFALMKKDAILVNLSRGGVIDERALSVALSSGQLAGAGVDVFALEPPDPTNDLIGLANVIASPHIGGVSRQSIRAMLEKATTSVIEVLTGRLPEQVVNPAALAMDSTAIGGSRGA